MTIDQLTKKYYEWEASQKATAEKVEKLEQERESIKQQKADAIENEDGQLYIKLKYKEDENEAEILILQNKLKKSFPISAEELTSAWESYVADFNVKKAKMEKALKSDLDKVGEDIREASALHRDAFSKRDFLAKLANIDGSAKRTRYPLQQIQLPRIPMEGHSELLGVSVLGMNQKEKNLVLSGFSLLE